MINNHVNNYVVFLIDQKGIIPPDSAGQLYGPIEFPEMPDLHEISYLVSLLMSFIFFTMYKLKK